MRRFRSSGLLDRLVTAWSCLLAPPLALVATGLALVGVVPWRLPAALFASVVLPPLLLAPPPVTVPVDGPLDETLRDRVHSTVHAGDDEG